MASNIRLGRFQSIPVGGVSISIQSLPGEHAFIDAAADVDALANSLDDLAKVMPEIQQIVINDAKTRFDEQGPGWAYWKLGFQEPAGSGEILNLFGHLRDFATSESTYPIEGTNILWNGLAMPEQGVGGAYGKTSASPSYPVLHQEGGRVAQREWAGLSDEAETEIYATVDVWVDKQVTYHFTGTGFVARSRATGLFVGNLPSG